jgi:hypothetical protein
MASPLRTGLFISHAHLDADLARLLCDFFQTAIGLDPASITCTSDEEHGLLSGESLNTQIKTRLNSAAVLILLSTNHSQNKDWVKYECAYAEGQGIPLHVLMPGEVYRDTVPEPYRDRVSVTLSNGLQVLELAEQLRRHFAGAHAGGTPSAALARLAHAAHTTEVERYRQLVTEEQQRSAQTTRVKARRWAGALAAVVMLGIASAWYLQRDFTGRLDGVNRDWEQKLESTTLDFNERHAAEVRRFSLRGNVDLAGTPARNVRIEVYRNLDDKEQPLAIDNTDDEGDYAFEEGELSIDPKERIDFVVRRPDGTARTKKVSAIDARLNISFR